MNPEAMKPFGQASLDYYQGNKDAAISVLRDDGWTSQMPASGFSVWRSRLIWNGRRWTCAGDMSWMQAREPGFIVVSLKKKASRCTP